MKAELRDKLKVSEEQNLQMANFIKSLSNQSENELTQMRNLIQSKVSDDHAV